MNFLAKLPSNILHPSSDQLQRPLRPFLSARRALKYAVKKVKMADEDVNGDSDEVQQEKSQKKAAKYDSGAADLERVTDYAEEKEISSSDGFSCALSIIGDRRNKEAAEKKAKEKELLKVSIKKEDVDLIMKEMEINRYLAEQTLREHRGDVVEALITLTN